MSQSNYQLAQVNIARLVTPLDDPQIADFVVNLSAWESLATLQDFTYRTSHVAIMRSRRREWFERPESAYPAL